MEFATQLKKYRIKHELSQDDLAGELFVSRQAVSKWENGDATPDLATLVKLAELLGVSLDTLVLGLEPKDTPTVDTAEYARDPTTGLYHRKYGQMNGWDFLARYWWILIVILAMVGGFLGMFLGR